MPYYHDLITEKSWQILQELKRRHTFILIGGWAVYLYTKQLKSKDVDVIWYDRAHSAKGEKDRIDIVGLVQSGIAWDAYLSLLNAHKLTKYRDELEVLLQEIIEVPELQLNAHQYAKLKRAALAHL